jgi:hypothetical protein
MSPTRALVVYVHYPGMLSYFTDWLDAFVAEPRLDVVPANLATPRGRRRVRAVAPDVDLIVLLHSVVGDSLSELQRYGAPLLERRGLLVAFVSNEVSLPTQPFADKIEALARLEPTAICTQLLLETSEYLYAETGAKVLAVPHALNPAVFRPEVDDAARPLDIGFRGARYLPHVGDDERNRIIDFFATATFDPPLATDIRTNVSYSRRAWAAFLNRSRATIGAESGAVEMTRDDAILGRTEAEHSVSSSDLRLRARLRPIHRYLPRPVKNVVRRTADRLAGRSDKPSPPPAQPAAPIAIGHGMSGKCLSSRHFDAIGTETCQILLPGRYNDLLEPDVHYLCLEPDFSNLDDVLARFRDTQHRLRLVRDTRAWALDGQTHAHRVKAVLDAVGVT